MPHPLPPSPNLEHLKNQAKSLLKAFQNDNPEAKQRVALYLRPRADGLICLADAQRATAGEYGFPSWAKLKSYIETLPENAPPPAKESRQTPRKRALQELAEEVMLLAREGETEKLVFRLLLPLRQFLDLRAYIAERGDYKTLVDALIPGLEHPNARVRYECANFVMDHLADERCAEPLRRLLDDPVPRVRRAALHALGCDACKLAPLPLEGDFLSVWIDKALNDASVQVRRHAAYGLGGDCYDHRAVNALETLLALETDAKTLQNARRALQRQKSLAPAAG